MAKKKSEPKQVDIDEVSVSPVEGEVSNLVEKPEMTSEMIEHEVDHVFPSKEAAEKSDIHSHNKFSKFKKSHEGSES